MAKRTKKKLMVYVYADQIKALKELAATMDDNNVSALIRRAIDAFLRK